MGYWVLCCEWLTMLQEGNKYKLWLRRERRAKGAKLCLRVEVKVSLETGKN